MGLLGYFLEERYVGGWALTQSKSISISKKIYIYYLFTKGKKNENDPGLEKLKIVLTRSLSETMEIWEVLLYLYKTPFLQTEEHKETKEYSEINRSAVLI